MLWTGEFIGLCLHWADRKCSIDKERAERSSPNVGHQSVSKLPAIPFVTGQVPREIPLLVEKPRRDDAAKQHRGIRRPRARARPAAWQESSTHRPNTSDGGRCRRVRRNRMASAFSTPSIRLDRIGESDPPARVFRLNLHKVAGNRGNNVPFPGCHVKLNPHP